VPALFEVSVKLVVRRGREILLLRRPSDTGDWFWDLPGGRLDAGEDIDTALTRELREEIGYHGDPPAQRRLLEAGLWHAKVLLYYEISILLEKVALSAEHGGFVWISPATAGRLEVLGGARIEPELRKLFCVL